MLETKHLWLSQQSRSTTPLETSIGICVSLLPGHSYCIPLYYFMSPCLPPSNGRMEAVSAPWQSKRKASARLAVCRCCKMDQHLTAKAFILRVGLSGGQGPPPTVWPAQHFWDGWKIKHFVFYLSDTGPRPGAPAGRCSIMSGRSTLKLN